MSVDKTLVRVHSKESFSTTTLTLSFSIVQLYKDFLCFSWVFWILCVLLDRIHEPRFMLWKPGIRWRSYALQNYCVTYSKGIYPHHKRLKPKRFRIWSNVFLFCLQSKMVRVDSYRKSYFRIFTHRWFLISSINFSLERFFICLLSWFSHLVQSCFMAYARTSYLFYRSFVDQTLERVISMPTIVDCRL